MNANPANATNLTIEMDPSEMDALMKKLPADVQAKYRAEALKRRLPVSQVMQEALLAVAADFQPMPEPRAA